MTIAHYVDPAAELIRQACSMAVLTLGSCANVFGTGVCTATGEPCYNTWPTCKDQVNFAATSRDYEWTSYDAPLPFVGPRPYLKSVKYLATEIKTSLTVKGQVDIVLADELDGDIGIDPYVDQRAKVQGSYFKKLVARNQNWKGASLKLYEGFIGQTKDEFALRWSGQLKNIDLSDGLMKISALDPLAKLSDIEVPAKVEHKLLAKIDPVHVEIILSGVSGLAAAGYLAIDDEVIQYGAIDAGQNRLYNCTRGCFDTIAAEHSADGKIQPVAYYPPQNPFDLLKSMLICSSDPEVQDPPGAGYAASAVDSAGFDSWRDWPGGDIDVSAIVVTPTKLDKLFFELVDLIDAKVWYSEGQNITIRRNIPNRPGFGTLVDQAFATEDWLAIGLEDGSGLLGLESNNYRSFSDTANIIAGTGSADLNEKSRTTEVALWWDRRTMDDHSKTESYQAIDVSPQLDAQYADGTKEQILCRWLRRGYMQDEIIESFVRAFVLRRLWRRKSAQPIIAFEVEIKDGAVRTGEWVKLSTDELLLPDGSPLEDARFQIIKRNPKQNRIAIHAVKTGEEKICVFAPVGHPDYAEASEAEREYGYFTNPAGTMPDGSPGYVFY